MRKLYFRPKHIAVCKFEDELVLLNTLSGEYFSLNSTGAGLYLALGIGVENACALSTEGFETAADDVQQIEMFLRGTLDHQLLGYIEFVRETPASITAEISSTVTVSAFPFDGCMQLPPTLSSWGHIMLQTQITPPSMSTT